MMKRKTPSRTELIETLEEAVADGLIAFMGQFATDETCRAYLEAHRWPDGPVCPHCHKSTDAYRIEGKSARHGLYTCKLCLKQFTVTVGTIFEGSHMPLPKWFACLYLMSASKKGISAHQLHRSLRITYKTAWAICHKIRGAMRSSVEVNFLYGTVEIDETLIGGKPRFTRRANRLSRRGISKKAAAHRMENKTIVMAMVERNGDIIARPIRNATVQGLQPSIERSVSRKATIMTDEWRAYRKAVGGREHRTVKHSVKEYATKDGRHINTAESFFALFKRGFHGTYHHFSPKWTSRYCGEFGFRWNTRQLTDGDRFKAALSACHTR